MYLYIRNKLTVLLVFQTAFLFQRNDKFWNANQLLTYTSDHRIYVKNIVISNSFLLTEMVTMNDYYVPDPVPWLLIFDFSLRRDDSSALIFLFNSFAV